MIIAEEQVSVFQIQITFIEKICFKPKEEKTEEILDREATFLIIYFIVTIKRSYVPYIIHNQICFTNKRFFLFFPFCASKKKKQTKTILPHLFLVCYYRHSWKQTIFNDLYLLFFFFLPFPSSQICPNKKQKWKSIWLAHKPSETYFSKTAAHQTPI